MKWFKFYFTVLLVVVYSIPGLTQVNDAAGPRMLRIYEDNDFINLRGKGTDEAYTNGFRVDYFYQNNGNSSFFLNKWMPKAGKSSVNTFGWGIMQLIYTPSNIRKPYPDPADFPYSGALFASRTLHSSDPERKYSVHSELQVGLIGPASLAKQTQTVFHDLINYQRPMGWDHQLPTDLIINLNLALEKELLYKKDWFHLIGGAQIMTGTMINSLSVYSLILLGKNPPYFGSYISRYALPKGKNISGRRQWQVYGSFKPRAEYVRRNALISGGYFNGQRDKQIKEARINNEPVISIPHRYILGFDYGITLQLNRTSVSVTQKVESAAIYGVSTHEVGNISVHFTW